ncbi:MAG: DUF6308 family protein [Actinophytocola sp.]|uniref:DUF6308 family protein n=1 Tax=Actinophytocola sp. TaxID=1872138 RepID=UPI003C7449D1
MTESVRPDAGSIVDGLLAETHSKALVAAYFDPDAGFAGGLFDSLGEPDPCRITVDDLLATSLLEVRFGPAAVRAILGPEADAISTLLAKVDPGVPIWEDHELLAGPLTELWKLLRGLRGVGRVTTSKLLARKRPHLVPIIDRVVLRTLRLSPLGSWQAIRGVLLDGERRARLAALAPSDEVSVLRLLDVLLWMRGSESRAVRQVRARLGIVG